MGILINLVLNNYFRPVNFGPKAPEQFCGTRVIITVSAKKNKEKMKLLYLKESFTDRRAYDYGLITILFESKMPHRNCLVLSNYKKESVEIWF